jgi:hypothetical protein
MQRDMFSPPDPHAQLQAFEPVQSSDAFPIHPPALATQEHPDAQVPKPWLGMGEISNPYLQRGRSFARLRRYQATRLNWANRQARAQLTENIP